MHFNYEKTEEIYLSRGLHKAFNKCRESVLVKCENLFFFPVCSHFYKEEVVELCLEIGRSVS